MSLLVRGAHQVVTPTGTGAQRGSDLAALTVYPGAVVRCENGRIAFVGDEGEDRRRFDEPDDILETEGGCVLPGFVDPHTHPVWAGSREDEFDRRLPGEPLVRTGL